MNLGDITSNLGADERTYLKPEETHLLVLNHNSAEFDRLVRDATKRVREHLGNTRRWYGIGPDDHDYFNPETGRGGCDDDILDTVRDDLMGDLLDDPRNESIAAESLSDAAGHAVHLYIAAEKLRSL